MKNKPLAVFVGPPAAGKIQLAKKVAKRLKVPFTDTDIEIESDWGKISNMFHERGEAFFREKERSAVIKALSSPGVVSLGGGAVTEPSTLKDLRSHRVVYLTVDAKTVEGRLMRGGRPLISGGIEDWKRLEAERRPLYLAVSKKIFDVSGANFSSLLVEISDWVREGLPK